MDAEKLIQSQIKELELKLAELHMLLHSVQTTKRKMGHARMRFFDWKPIDAARVVLEENGKKMKRSELIEAMIAGGIKIGKKRPDVNIRRSFVINIESGNLIEDGDHIDIPR